MLARTVTTRRRFETSCRRTYAFTLAEMVVVTLILSILAAVSVPRYIDSLARYQVDCAACRIKVDLELQRQEARKASASRTITFDINNHSYTMVGTTDLNHAGQNDYVVKLKLAPYRATLKSANCGGDATLVFNGFGQPDSSATIVVESGSYAKTITVESTAGKVTIE